MIILGWNRIPTLKTLTIKQLVCGLLERNNPRESQEELEKGEE